jgi:hypothetical protein
MVASGRRALQKDHRGVEATRIVACDLLHSIRDRREVVGAERRRHEHDVSMLAIRGDELSGQLREILDVARDDGAVCTGGIARRSKLAGVARNLVRAHDVESAATKHLGDARREVLVEVERHLPVTTRTNPG